ADDQNASRKSGRSRANGTDSAIAETKGKGFDGGDFSYDVFGSPPGQDPIKNAELAKAKDIADKPKVMAKQQKLLRELYMVDCKTQSGVTMTKGKAQPVGPTARLKDGLTWDQLGKMTAEDIKSKQAFPAGYHRLPHVKHDVGGMVFPQMQIKLF